MSSATSKLLPFIQRSKEYFFYYNIGTGIVGSLIAFFVGINVSISLIRG
ncbi:MAG: hypothetical protein P4M11_14375 [Candidatus Pacebacteria bacterium]|nr:hypothetical protein [Candidatus Paceibacterota bacterium]